MYDLWMFAQVFRGPTGGTYPHPPCVGAYLIISRLWEPRQLEILHAIGLAAGSGDACGDPWMLGWRVHKQLEIFHVLGLAAGAQQLGILHVMGLAAGSGRNMVRSLDLGLDATIKGMIFS